MVFCQNRSGQTRRHERCSPNAPELMVLPRRSSADGIPNLAASCSPETSTAPPPTSILANPFPAITSRRRRRMRGSRWNRSTKPFAPCRNTSAGTSHAAQRRRSRQPRRDSVMAGLLTEPARWTSGSPPNHSPVSGVDFIHHSNEETFQSTESGSVRRVC